MERIQERIGHVRIHKFPYIVAALVPAIADRGDFIRASLLRPCVKYLHEDSLTVTLQVRTEILGEYEG